jgi:hypothetical protein
MSKMFKAIETKLQNALTISFICDLWSTKQMRELCGLAAAYTDAYFHRHTIVIGMSEMQGGPSAVNIQKAIDEIILNYSSLKHSKISGWFKI